MYRIYTVNRLNTVNTHVIYCIYVYLQGQIHTLNQIPSLCTVYIPAGLDTNSTSNTVFMYSIYTVNTLNAHMVYCRVRYSVYQIVSSYTVYIPSIYEIR